MSPMHTRALDCLRREARIRESVYPRQVATGRMSAGEAAAEMAAIKAAIRIVQHHDMLMAAAEAVTAGTPGAIDTMNDALARRPDATASPPATPDRPPEHARNEISRTLASIRDARRVRQELETKDHHEEKQ